VSVGGDTLYLIQRLRVRFFSVERRGPSRAVGGHNVVTVAFLVALSLRLMRTFGRASGFVCWQLDWQLVNQSIGSNLMRSTTCLRICATLVWGLASSKKGFRELSSPGRVGGHERMMMMKTESLRQLVDGLNRQSRGNKGTSTTICDPTHLRLRWPVKEDQSIPH
jgi:hypothetical protein